MSGPKVCKHQVQLKICELEADHEKQTRGSLPTMTEKMRTGTSRHYSVKPEEEALSAREESEAMSSETRSERLVSGNRCASHATLQHNLQFFSLS